MAEDVARRRVPYRTNRSCGRVIGVRMHKHHEQSHEYAAGVTTHANKKESERERDTDRQRERETERDRERGKEGEMMYNL